MPPDEVLTAMFGGLFVCGGGGRKNYNELIYAFKSTRNSGFLESFWRVSECMVIQSDTDSALVQCSQSNTEYLQCDVLWNVFAWWRDTWHFTRQVTQMISYFKNFKRVNEKKLFHSWLIFKKLVKFWKKMFLKHFVSPHFSYCSTWRRTCIFLGYCFESQQI